jgi:hypothetical protein
MLMIFGVEEIQSFPEVFPYYLRIGLEGLSMHDPTIYFQRESFVGKVIPS